MPDGVHPGHHRADVPAVRGDDRRVGAHLGVQRADAEPGACGAAAAAAARCAGRSARSSGGFNRWFARATDGYVGVSAPHPQGRRLAGPARASSGVAGAASARELPAASCPRRTRATSIVNVQLPDGGVARSARPRSATSSKTILKATPGRASTTPASPASACSAGRRPLQRLLLHHARSRGTSATSEELTADVIIQRQITRELRASCPRRGVRRSRRPPSRASAPRAASPSCCEDRAGRTSRSSPQNTAKFLAAARKRPEFAHVDHDASRPPCRSSSPTSTATRC